MVTQNITSPGNDTKAAFQNCAPFKDCTTEINDSPVEHATFINITMPMYNLIEYSDNYFDTSASLWQFKRDKQPKENNGELSDLIADSSSSFRYKSNPIDSLRNGGRKNGVKIAVPVKYFSNFWISLEMSLISCKVELSLTWNQKCA